MSKWCEARVRVKVRVRRDGSMKYDEGVIDKPITSIRTRDILTPPCTA